RHPRKGQRQQQAEGRPQRDVRPQAQRPQGARRREQPSRLGDLHVTSDHARAALARARSSTTRKAPRSRGLSLFSGGRCSYFLARRRVVRRRVPALRAVVALRRVPVLRAVVLRRVAVFLRAPVAFRRVPVFFLAPVAFFRAPVFLRAVVLRRVAVFLRAPVAFRRVPVFFRAVVAFFRRVPVLRARGVVLLLRRLSAVTAPGVRV